MNNLVSLVRKIVLHITAANKTFILSRPCNFIAYRFRLRVPLAVLQITPARGVMETIRIANRVRRLLVPLTVLHITPARGMMMAIRIANQSISLIVPRKTRVVKQMENAALVQTSTTTSDALILIVFSTGVTTKSAVLVSETKFANMIINAAMVNYAWGRKDISIVVLIE